MNNMNDWRIKKQNIPGVVRAGATVSLLILSLVTGGCPSTPNGGGGTTPTPHWEPAFDTSQAGDLSGVWGSAPDDVFIVGGTVEQGEVYHFDGSTWSPMQVPPVPRLVWCFGFSHDNVVAVGEGGGFIHFDGNAWTQLDSGETEALWGVWARSPSEWWIVGGDIGEGDPVLMRWDGETFEHLTPPPNDRGATALFKVWGIGSKLFAVGQSGLIIQESGGSWAQVPTGPLADDDFVSLWGLSEDNIVAVGGRSAARIARYDGTSWTTELASGVGGLSGTFMNVADESIVGGINGFVGAYNPMTGGLTAESSGTSISIHAIWGDGAGRNYAVGGTFSRAPQGVALVRTVVNE